MSDHEQRPPNAPDGSADIIELCDDPKAARRARLAAACHFGRDVAKIQDAMLEYQGTFPTLEKYVRLEIEDHIPPYMHWMLDDFVDVSKIARHWINLGRNWVLLDKACGSDTPRGVHVFLASPRPSARG